MNSKPFSQACENNKAPILQILQTVFTTPVTLWEIGSGTGQHACHFAGHLPHLRWQPTDRPANLPGIRLWLDEAKLSNINPPLAIDVNDQHWPCARIEGLFTANTLHIMSWAEVEKFFQHLGNYLAANAIACIYGPFNYHGHYTSDSNARFDAHLKSQNPLSGIRDFEAVMKLAHQQGLSLNHDHAMPANNRLLVLQKGLDQSPTEHAPDSRISSR